MTSSLALRVAARSMAHRVAARYKSKKKVKTQDGEEMTVYEYSDKQVAHRNKKKAERIEKLRKSIDKIRTTVKKDLKSSDKAKAMTALVVGLIDDTFERVGNEGSAKDGHYGVTGWKKKHVTFGSGGATIKYVGKSGVKHEKKVSDPTIRKALKKAYDECEGDNKGLFEWDGGSVTAEKVNEYLKPFDITAKDLRGFHANREMTEHLKAIRAKGKDLPEEKKAREKLLKKEFLKALDETAEAVGHEAATLRSMYLVPGLEEQYMKDGTVSDKLSSQRVAERYLLASARYALTEIGEKVFGRFKVRYLKQHEGVVDKLGSQLLEAEKAYESAGVPIVHEIQVALTGAGASHALGLYTMGSVPPTIQIAPKSYADPKLVHTLIHELGHYFHDKVVPGGIQNPAIISKHMWAVRQKPTGHGNQVDVLNRKLKSLNDRYFKLNEERSLKKPLPRKGQVFEYDPWVNGKQYHVKGRIVGKRDSRTVNVEIVEAPPEYMERQRIYRRGPGPLIVPEAVAVLTFTGVNEAAVAELEKVEKERHEVHEQLKSLISEGKANDDRYEVHIHDWVPTTYARKDHFEYFAEMLTTFVLGHLKPEPAEWLKSVLKTGAAPSQEVSE